MTASEISRVPDDGGLKGGRRSSSCEEMFSSTMMASSMTMPVETEPQMVRFVQRKPSTRMAVKVARIDTGIARRPRTRAAALHPKREDPVTTMHNAGP